MPLIFDRATAAEVLLLRDLAERIWHESYATMLSVEQRRYMLDWMYAPHKLEAEIERGVNYFVVRQGHLAIGYLAWEILPGGKAAHLNKLYLLPEFQGRGYGSEMLARFLEDARWSGAQRAELRVNRANARAIKAYERAGFSRFQALTTSIGAGYVMDDYVMRRVFTVESNQRDKGDPSCE